MKITAKPFGITRDSHEVTMFQLENSMGNTLELLDFGCNVRSLKIKDRQGNPVDVVLGYDHMAQYEPDDAYFGATVGRHANRIGGASFLLGGKEYPLAANNGVNHVHGGNRGFNLYIWRSDIHEDGVTFSRVSPAGEEGYPGNLKVSVSFTFTQSNELVIEYTATSDADTVVNLANHSYFNLNGSGTVLEHQLQILAESYAENDSGCLPTGRISPVAGTPMDFRNFKVIGADIGSSWEQLAMFGGYDHNFVLEGDGYRKVATLRSSQTGITMDVLTTKPGMQFYTANAMSPRQGKDGAVYGPFCGLCLETQFFPNAMRCPNFPSPVLRAGETYSHKTTYAFSVE